MLERSNTLPPIGTWKQFSMKGYEEGGGGRVQHKHFSLDGENAIHSVWHWPLIIRGNVDLKFFPLPRNILSWETKSSTLLSLHVLWKRHNTKTYHHLECIYYSTQVVSLCLHKNIYLSCESEPCIQAFFVKPRFRYGQITPIKMALQN